MDKNIRAALLAVYKGKWVEYTNRDHRVLILVEDVVANDTPGFAFSFQGREDLKVSSGLFDVPKDVDIKVSYIPIIQKT